MLLKKKVEKRNKTKKMSYNHGLILNGLSISAKRELQSLCCMMGKRMSLRCHFLAVIGWRLIDWIQKNIKLSI